MQPWSDQGQAGAEDQDSWLSGFAYADQNGQYDPAQQSWPQPITGSTVAYSNVNDSNAQDGAPSAFFDASHQAGPFLGAHLPATQTGQTPFHDGHDAVQLDQQPYPPGQDIADAVFNTMPGQLFSQQPGQVNVADSGGMGPIVQAQSHPHTHPQAFAQHGYSFAPQAGQPFDPTPVPQYSPPTMISRQAPSRPQSQSTVQHQFDGNLHTGLSQSHAFSRPLPESSAQHQQQPYPAAGQAFASPANGGPNRFPASLQAHAAYPEASPTPHLHQHSFQQSEYASKPLAYQQPGLGSADQSQLGQQPHPLTVPLPQEISQASGKPISPANADIQHASSHQTASIESGAFQKVPAAPLKKRKRPVKSAVDASSSIGASLSTVMNDVSTDAVGKRTEDIDVLQAPTPNREEAQLLSDSEQRCRSAQNGKFPIESLPFLAYNGSIKLPVPKSYDKLVPLVALPSRSGKNAVLGLGYALPCEIQGKFASQYKPSFDKCGLDERRIEAKGLLDEYDRSIKALGKRQPKYTEYPLAFKEQLKADEATKNKAEKKAKKELEEERNKPIRPAVRPTDPVAAAAWDAIGIVHIDQSASRGSAVIAGRVQQAGEFLISLRSEASRAQAALDQATKDKKTETIIAKLKEETEQKKSALFQALDATAEHADDAVLDNLGGHQKLVLSLVNILISSIKSGDTSGKLPKVVLELFIHFRMTKKLVETPNFDTVRRRLEDKGDEEMKGLVRELSAKMKKFSKTTEGETITGYTGTSAASRAKARSKAASEGPSAKRSRDDDSDGRVVKKIAVEPGSSSLSKKLAQPKVQPHAKTTTTSSSSSSTMRASSSSTILPGKSRPVAKPVSKADTLGGLGSATTAAEENSKTEQKRQSTKSETRTSSAAAAGNTATTTGAVAAKIITSKKEGKPMSSKVGAASASGSVSGIASLLDSINAKKPGPSVAPTEGRMPESQETAEEKTKRLRKEARRKLRVSWKPESELVQIKVFEKDDEEDEGRDINMIRDAADDRSEGMVLKRRMHVDVDDDEDDDDDDDDDDIPYQPWLAPTTTDFSSIAEEIRKKSYVTRGGHIKFETEEQKRIADREQRELMAIYPDSMDIPPSPRSPPPEVAAGTVDTRVGHLPHDDPKFEELQVRWNDTEQVGFDEALQSALRRLEARGSLSVKLNSALGRLSQRAPSSSADTSSTLASQSLTTSPTLTNQGIPFVAGPALESRLLGWLKWDMIRAWRDPQSLRGDAYSRGYRHANALAQTANNAVEAVVSKLSGKPYPAVSPPEWLLKDEEKVREWWLGHNKESAARQRREEEQRAKLEAETKALRSVGSGMGSLPLGGGQDWGTLNTPQRTFAPYMALLQQMNSGHPLQIPENQLQSLLTAINQPHQQQPAHDLRPPGIGHSKPMDSAYQQALMQLQMVQGQPALAVQGAERDWDRKEPHAVRGEVAKEAKGGRKKKTSAAAHKANNAASGGARTCTFWQQGKCGRGGKCTFRHE